MQTIRKPKRERIHQAKERAEIVVTGKDLQIAKRFVEPFLEDVYTDATAKVCLYRTLKRIKKALRQVLKTLEAPKDLNELTAEVHSEL